MTKVAVIGVGNMGSKYASLIFNHKVEGLKLAALTRLKSPYIEMLQSAIDEGIPIFNTSDLLFSAVTNGNLDLDAVIIATPHYSHEDIAIKAFSCNLHVLSDKPAGVYSRQARLMDEAARKYKKVYSMIFNQRTHPVFIELKRIIDSHKYGNIKRVNWIVTDWYRPEKYYSSSSWHATWSKDGGGILLNQAPHNLDLLQWICGMPCKVRGFCKEGHYHNIQVEDDVTTYLEWSNGATGTFITSTGEAPGINRLEISLDEALIVCENNTLKIGELYPEIGQSELNYRLTSNEYFKKLYGTWSEKHFTTPESSYELILQAFSDECNGKGKSIASGSEGRNSLLLSNSIYLSSWEDKVIELPIINSKSELEFEKIFENRLHDKCNNS